MLNSIKLFFKGFVIGISNLIPGLSGGTVALILGIYEEFLGALGHLFQNFKKNIIFLAPVLTGMVFSLISLSGVISYCLTNFLFVTILFFCGAIFGGIPKILKEMKGYHISFGNTVSFILAFLAVTVPLMLKGAEPSLSATMTVSRFIILVLLGMVASSTMVMPGVSGSAVLMAVGYYHYIIDSLHSLSSPDSFATGISVVIPYGIGLALGLILASRLIEECLKRWREKSFFAIMGFVVSSILVILLQNDILRLIPSLKISEIVLGIILFLSGCFATAKLGD